MDSPRLHAICRGLLSGLLLLPAVLPAQNLDITGVTLLRAQDASLTGGGVSVAQVESPENGNSPVPFEVSPAAVSQPVSLFTYVSDSGSASTFPNAVGSESGHADAVGSFFYGSGSGVAPGIGHVDVYEANHFVNSFALSPLLPAIPAKVVNQSFIFGDGAGVQQQADTAYDKFAAKNGTLFVSAVGNGGAVHAPGTAYNSLGVGAVDGGSSTGPTPDNGRCKPDLVAPGGATSFSTPYVAGAATVLLQAALRNDGGSGTSANASDLRTLKCLLLNGALKPADWTNSAAHPLDFRYGAGIVHLYQAWRQLTGGKAAVTEATSVSLNAAHPPGTNPGQITNALGWDFASLNSTLTQDRIAHYYLALGDSPLPVTLTATLVWNRQQLQTDLNNLDLFLYHAATGTLVGQSTSLVDNVEHLCLASLPPGRYDLQVLKHGGLSQPTTSETYALSFAAYTAPTLTVQPGAAQTTVRWPVWPAGFVLEKTAAFSSAGSWTAVSGTPDVTNGQQVLTLPTAVGTEFYRLRRPHF